MTTGDYGDGFGLGMVAEEDVVREDPLDVVDVEVFQVDLVDGAEVRRGDHDAAPVAACGGVVGDFKVGDFQGCSGLSPECPSAPVAASTW